MTTNTDEAVTFAEMVQADGLPDVLVSTHQMNPDGMNVHSTLDRPGIVHNEKVVQ